MDLITTAELRNLLSGRPGWHVSMFMPTHRAGRETGQDPIRFKNLLRKAEEGLLAKGLRSIEVRAILKPAQRLLEDPIFWHYQSDGLAVFLTPQEFYAYRLPLSFEEQVMIIDRFYLKPLLPLFVDDGHYYILALSQKQVRLLEGTRHTVDEVELKHTPQSLAEALQYDHFEKQLQFHTGTSGGAGKRPAMFHGHDVGDEEKERILQWFQRIDDELSKLLAGRQSPLVLAGVEYLLPFYRQANSYAHLIPEGIPGNPDELKHEALHARAWPLVHPVFVRTREETAARYRELAGTGRTTTDVAEAVLAARHGRVEALFVTTGVQVWGRFDPATNTVHVHQSPEIGDEDLLDLAAIHSILNGVRVYAVGADQMPDHAPLAAVFRY
jgi:hypothetical protein